MLRDDSKKEKDENSTGAISISWNPEVKNSPVLLGFIKHRTLPPLSQRECPPENKAKAEEYLNKAKKIIIKFPERKHYERKRDEKTVSLYPEKKFESKIPTGDSLTTEGNAILAKALVDLEQKDEFYLKAIESGLVSAYGDLTRFHVDANVANYFFAHPVYSSCIVTPLSRPLFKKFKRDSAPLLS